MSLVMECAVTLMQVNNFQYQEEKIQNNKLVLIFMKTSKFIQ